MMSTREALGITAAVMLPLLIAGMVGGLLMALVAAIAAGVTR